MTEQANKAMAKVNHARAMHKLEAYLSPDCDVPLTLKVEEKEQKRFLPVVKPESLFPALLPDRPVRPVVTGGRKTKQLEGQGGLL
jgi:hypothetical protein